ncbi:hypothetical protein GCM10009668_07120 [Nocardioides dubius]|uniref:Uncharacterized protein n=1 Tax=Nocardioides dubius TaxID=317019 RepID=A0ABN1TMJ3_9ACTN
MVTEASGRRFAITSRTETGQIDAAWWPQSRQLGEQLPALLELWPAASTGLQRILYCPHDWDDHPHSVPVGDRLIATDSVPDSTRTLVLQMDDGTELTLRIIAPGATQATAAIILNSMVLEVLDLPSLLLLKKP